jgi:hypothetical protein
MKVLKEDVKILKEDVKIVKEQVKNLDDRMGRLEDRTLAVEIRLLSSEGSRDTVGRLDKLTAVVYEMRQELDQTREELRTLHKSFEEFKQETNQNFEEIRVELKHKYVEIACRLAFDEYTFAHMQQQFEKFATLPNRVSELEKSMLK